MNENLNLCELLKGHEGETFYSPIFGEVTLNRIEPKVTYPIMGTIDGVPGFVTFSNDGKIYAHYKDGQVAIFPSKDQRDWNKWAEEQKPKVPKTWNGMVKQKVAKPLYACIGYDATTCNCIESSGTTSMGTPVEKAALALLKIRQLIEVGYGGNITNEEWGDTTMAEYSATIRHDEVGAGSTFVYNTLIAFRTKELRNEFLSYPENVQLVKDLYMV